VKTQYKSFNFRGDSLAKIELANSIIASYQAQGFRLTLRQLYYQFVTRNALPNREKSYDSLGRLVSDARLAGLIDWDAIEDRVRVPRLPTEFSDIKGLIDVALQSYRLPRWKGQYHYIELWVEKDALSGVLAPLTAKYHITLMVNRGYSSQSAMYEAGLRFGQHLDKICNLFYLGDHDPSGEDMVRDVEDRLTMFGADLTVKKIALTMDQVRQYNPPPNPAKQTDTRASAYIAKYGLSSWEVDALPPDVLHQLVEEAILEVLDGEGMNQIIDTENQDKTLLIKVADAVLEGKTAYAHKLGRKPLQLSVKNILDTLQRTRSIGKAAQELKCSRGHIYGVLKTQGLTAKGFLYG
jgi:hypothetical protein